MKTQRLIAYRCPECGTAVVGDLNLFILGGQELNLNCKECSAPGLNAKLGKDSKLYLTVPCLTCPHPHHYCVETKTVFSRDLFVLQCALTGLDLCFIGEEHAVEDALEKNRQELLALSDELADEEEAEEDAPKEAKTDEHPPLFDPVLTGQMLYLIREFAQDGRISCSCGETHLDFRLLPDGFLFTCPKCRAAKVFPAMSESDRMRLEELTEIRLDGGENDK